MTSETTQTETAGDEAGDPTLQWETMGLRDRPVEVARTVTMGTRFEPGERTPEDLVGQLPNLVDPDGETTLPELDIKGTIGEGGMGRVELAEQTPLGRDVAVKKVREDAASDRARLLVLREGWTTGRLEHPNIVPVYTLGRNERDEPVIVMKEISGTPWLDIIEDPDRAPEAFDFDDPIDLHVQILIKILNAVDYAHSRQIIHCDLKPENVMLGEFGEVYLLDWGVAMSLEPDPTGRLRSIDEIDQPTGTPAYMAPEMAEGDGTKLGVHSDIFLLGATLYEALNGHPPYDGQTLYQLMLRAYQCDHPPLEETAPPELVAICRRAMNPEPTERFESARTMREALLDFQKNRQSRHLAATGRARLEDVEQLLERERSGDQIDEPTLYRTFGECRFAYEQALQQNPDNRRAADDLQRALEMMAERAIDRDAYKAASLLISDLPRPNPELQQRLDELEQRLEDRQQDYEQLREIRREIDVDIGRGGRIAFLVVMGTLWIVVSSAAAPLLATDILDINYQRLVGHGVMLNVVTILVVLLGRDYFIVNEINRRMLWSVVALFCGATVHRASSWFMEIPFRSAVTTEMLIYGLGTLVMALTLDRRLLGAAIPYGLATLGAMLAPGLVFWIFAGVNLLVVITMCALWWPDEPREQLNQITGE